MHRQGFFETENACNGIADGGRQGHSVSVHSDAQAGFIAGSSDFFDRFTNSYANIVWFSDIFWWTLSLFVFKILTDLFKID